MRGVLQRSIRRDWRKTNAFYSIAFRQKVLNGAI